MQDHCFIDYFAFPYSEVFLFLLNQYTGSNISGFFFQPSLTSLHFSCSFVTPTSFVFGDEDVTSVECYTETLNYTYKVSVRAWLVQSVWMDPPQFHSLSTTSSAVFVCLQVLNSGPSRSRDTVVGIMLPKILAPHRHRLLQLVDWQVRQQRCCAHQSHASLWSPVFTHISSYFVYLVTLKQECPICRS